MIFKDRQEAAKRLSEKLSKYAGKNTLVLAIPRGAVPMARTVADDLRAELDVVLVRKIGAPDNPEYAVGSISEFGDVYLSDAASLLGISQAYLNQTAADELRAIGQRRRLYTPHRHPANPKGRTVVVIDDGLATGATMISAVRSLRAKGAAKIVVAVPVAARDAYKRVRSEADEVIAVHLPEEFYSVSMFYEDFSQVSDDEVIAVLNRTQAA